MLIVLFCASTYIAPIPEFTVRMSSRYRTTANYCCSWWRYVVRSGPEFIKLGFLFCLVSIESYVCHIVSWCQYLIDTFLLRAAVSAFRPCCPSGIMFCVLFSCWRKIHTYTVSQKNCITFIFTVTLANVGRFLKFFQCRNQKEMAHNKNEKFPTVA